MKLSTPRGKGQSLDCSSLNLGHLAHTQCGIHIFRVGRLPGKQQEPNTCYLLLLTVLLHQHTSISARQEEERGDGNWRAQCQGDFQSCPVFHFLTTRGVLTFILAEPRTPCSSSCHNNKKKKLKGSVVLFKLNFNFRFQNLFTTTGSPCKHLTHISYNFLLTFLPFLSQTCPELCLIRAELLSNLQRVWFQSNLTHPK